MSAFLTGMKELQQQESWIITAYEEHEYQNENTRRIIHIVPAFTWLLQQ